MIAQKILSAGTMARTIARNWPVGFVTAGALALSGCGESNTYVPPPPPKVTVANPVSKPYTRYLTATGNAAAINTANLVARVSGFLQSVNYKDGTFVKKGTLLFVIEPEPYKLQVDQSKAAKVGAQATYNQQVAELKRQQDLAAKEFASQAKLDSQRASTDNAQANLQSSTAALSNAEINYSYTHVRAPFDGIVTARQVSVGDYVGGSGQATVLSTIVQTAPIYVNFSINEQQAQRIRDGMIKRGIVPEEIEKEKFPVEAALQTDTGYPYKGKIDYVNPTVDTSTGTIFVRGIFPNTKGGLVPGYFIRVRVPLAEVPDAVMVPDAALGSDQAGRYVLIVNKDNVVESRRVAIGQTDGDMRVIDSGLKPDDRVVVAGLVRAVPGQKVDPQMQVATTAPSDSKTKDAVGTKTGGASDSKAAGAPDSKAKSVASDAKTTEASGSKGKSPSGPDGAK